MKAVKSISFDGLCLCKFILSDNRENDEVLHYPYMYFFHSFILPFVLLFPIFSPIIAINTSYTHDRLHLTDNLVFAMCFIVSAHYDYHHIVLRHFNVALNVLWHYDVTIHHAYVSKLKPVWYCNQSMTLQRAQPKYGIMLYTAYWGLVCVENNETTIWPYLWGLQTLNRTIILLQVINAIS